MITLRKLITFEHGLATQAAIPGSSPKMIKPVALITFGCDSDDRSRGQRTSETNRVRPSSEVAMRFGQPPAKRVDG